MTKPESGPPAPKPVASSNGTVTAASSSSSSSSSGGALRWTKVETVAARGSGGGDVPTRRSGHSLSVVGSNGFLFGGCDHREPPGPTNDLFVLRIGAQAPWEWEKLRSPPGTAPPPRWKHSATVVDGKVFIFGGFQSSTARLNDLWVFNPITMDWSQPADKSGAGVAPGAASLSAAGAPHRTSVAATRASSAVVPAPRGGHSAVAIRKCIYVFGGYGGAGYGRRDFDDLHVLRCDDASWSKVASKGRAPEKRAGHQACAVDDVMVVCGGWNSVAQFNDLHVFDTRTGAWAAVEGPQMATPLPRWNHAACAVAAIPHAKVFTFGGVLGEPGNYNGQGTFANDIAVLDSGDMSWTSPEVRGAPPCGRSDTTLAYDDKGSRLLLFGGWANAWLNDLYCLDVSCVVGPPYGVTGVFPAFGPSTGGTALVLDGIDFVNKPVTVRFACRQGAVDVPGEFVDDHTLHVTTPDFTAFPPGDVQVRIALLGDSFTTTFQTFAFFAVTHASLCFAYGPGVLCGGASGEPTSFIIQARDAARGLRTRGGDVFTVEVVAAAGGGPLFLPTLTIQDLMNGRYLVSYTVQAAGEYAVHVAFQGTFGGAAGPIRKSPHVVSFDDTVTREMNLLTGKLVLDQVLQDLQALQQASRDCNVGLEQPLSDPSWTPEQTTNALIALKAHVFHVEKRGEDTALSLDELRAELAFLEDAGLAVAKERETLGAIELAWLEIQRKVPAASARIAPLIAAQSLAFRAEMDGYGAELQRREAQLKAKGFWSFAVGATAALDAIAAERAAFEAEDAAAARKRHIAEILECSELLEPCDKALSAARRTLEHAQQLWDAIADVARKLELAQDVPWSLIDGAALEEEAKAFLALVKGVHKEARDCDAYRHFERLVRDFLSTCPLFQALRHPAMRRRHWQELAAATGRAVACPDDTPALKFADVLALRLHECQRDVEEIADRAQKEAKQEAALQDLEARWAAASFAMARHAETGTPLLRLAEDTVEMLEADQLLLQAMAVSPTHFQAQTQRWCSALVVVADVAAALSEIQRAWAYLEPLFMRSDEVARELPDEAARFAEIDARVQQTLQLMWSQRASGNVLLACALPDLLQSLSDLRARLEASQQALKEYLDAKRRLFPRFYFVSEADLLDLLSTGSRPASILVHLEKLFLATRTLVLEKGAASASSSSGAMTTTTTMLATHFISNDAASERIPFEHALALSGKVELYLQVLLDAMQHTLREHVARSVRRFPEQHRAEWLLQKLPAGSSGGSDAALAPMDAAQAALLVAGVEFANSVENAFVLLASGRATAMTELHDKVVAQLTDLVRLTQTPLSRPDRQRVMSLITADAHARDVALETFVHAACEERGLWPHEPFRLKVVQLEELLAIRHCVFVMGSPGSGKTECCETLVAARRRQGDAHHTKVVAWRAFLASWVSTKGATLAQRAALGEAVTRYTEPSIAFVRDHCKTVVPMEDIALVQTYLYFLDALLDAEALADPKRVDVLSGFIAVWAFGAALTVTDDGTDYRKVFSEWWRAEFKHLKFPTRDTVFDYWLNPATLGFDLWRASPHFRPVRFDGSVAMSAVTVPTPETAAITNWMSLMVREARPFMLCGGAGTGKTQLVQGVLASIDSFAAARPLKGPAAGSAAAASSSLSSTRSCSVLSINFNYYTSASALQLILESKLSKRVGATFGPSAGGQLVYFLDDLNLPQVDAYNTQSALALLRQYLDYGLWYDRARFAAKQIQDVQLLSCMNPGAGSFVVNPRLQRHFVTFALAQPSPASLQVIYATFLEGYVADFVEDIRKLAGPVLKAALGLHAQVSAAFRKTAANFHYEFNLRHVANVVQGLLMARPATFEDPVKFALLWVHESARVYGDRLVTASDLRKFTVLVHQQARRCFPSFNFTRYFVPPSLPSPEPSGGGGGALAPSDPILFAHIANGLRANEYDQVVSLASLQGVVEEALSEYNDALPRMALVLFRDALEHVARIVRILSNPSGHAMLVGVGGSGRKSLARLAVFVCGLALVEVAPTHAYSLLDFKTDLQSMVTKAGVRGEGLVFLFSDSQITHERMLVPLNDLLSSGSIPDLFTADEQANLVQQVLPRANAALAAAGTAGVTAAGDVPEKERCWRWVVHETKRNLHVVLCFSPATAAFRLRARRFPALVNCTLIDWFQPWPSDALHSVAARFLSPDSDPVLAACVRDSSGGDALVAVVQSFMPFAFESTNALAADFLRLEQRRVYATPKSFLECLTLFRELLARKHAGHERATLRLESGLEKMKATSHVVATMELELARTLAEAEAKRALAEELAARLRTDKEVVERETAKANSERETCALIQADVAAKKADTEADLAQAQPMVDAAMAALDTLSKKDLGSCKTMSKPPAGVGDVFGAVVVLFAGVNANVVVQKSGKVKDKDRAWEASKKALLGNINAFVDELKGFKAAVDEQRVPETNWREVRPFLQLEHFSVESIEKKNSAAAGLCAWVINIVAYYDAIVVVEPKKAALAAATDRLRAANDTLARVNARLGALEAQLALLSDEFARTSQAVQDAVAAVERGRLRIELATRLTAALGSESVRWTRELAALRERAGTLVCDVLVAASFVSYIGAFTKPFRDVLLADRWVPFLRQALAARKDAPSGLLADRCHPLEVLASDAEVAEWTARGLPSDRVSVENAAIARCSRRAPLLVDPQLQGIYWLREMEKHARRAHPSSFQVVRQDQPNLPQLLEAAVERGHAVLVENMAEAVEPCLWPLIARATTTRGLKTFLALGDRLVALHANFRLYLHTKLSNPHFPPELQAEAALVNFAVTQQGLEDQLLALVVRHEWPRKARARTALVLQQSEFTVRVQALEDRILSSLADAEGDVTENVQVIADLEATKATAVEIARKAAKAAEYEAQLRALAAKYQAVASRGALLFFLLDGLARLHTYYVFSLNAFVVIFQRGIDLEPNELAAQADDSSRPPSGGGGGLLSRLKAAAKKVLATQRFQWNADLLLADRVADSGGAELALEALLQQSDEDAMPSDAQIAARCAQLNERVTAVVFNYVRRGCFEKHKLALATQLCFAVLQAKRTMQSADVRQLVTAAPSTDPGGPGMDIVSEWLSDALWRRVRRLEESVASLQKLTTHIKSDADEWREWFEADAPEAKPLPGPYRVSATPLQRLHVVRVLRPDRTLAALEAFVAAQLGAAFTQQPPFDMEAAYLETSASTPMLFVLFPGVDPTAWVERLGRKFDITYERGKLVNISMGQGQEAAADRALLRFAREGSWVVLQNVHLMPAWLPTLERSLELYSVSADPNFRCFLSAEPPAAGALSNLPESLLQSCIKVANEAPTDLKSNLRRAWANFSLAHIAASARPREYQGCLFALCFFHALVLGRRRFGAQGWSRPYSFNTGDLLICADVLRRYLEHPPSKGGGSDNGSSTNDGTGHLPWDDLRYIFGEIMYGGHITDPWDRITSHAYLSSVFTPAVLTGAELAPGFKCPDPAAFTYAKYASYIETELPVEAPGVYGLHPNAEIGYLVDAADKLFFAIARFEPLASGGLGSAGSAGSTSSKDAAQVVTTIEALLERLPAELELTALQARAAPLLTLDRGPYVVVALQEAARMNGLVREVRDTLSELLKGLSGALSMTEPMEDLLEALMAGQVPGRNALHRCSWERVAWSSRKALGPWFADFVERAASLAAWAAEFRLPYSVWLAGLFNPAAFLTAIKQCTARQHGLALDAVAIETHCTTLRGADAAEAYPDRGAFVHGLFLEGARWEPPEKDGEPASPFAYEVDGVPCGGHVVDPAPKELFPATPVVYARAVAVAAQWEATGVGYFRRQRDVFDCPVYQTTQRGATYVFLATLHTVAPPHKWVLAGLALVMQRDDDS
ncbi:hypothetical protein PybrP1_007938 [[Pythium] brassicae (nom. inval.)]|nr:hypothetical protein PybrP1_007938 [[Pythium] brassicae (nom. inval.)]